MALSLAPHDRPREKLDRLGAVRLGDNELLAIVVGLGTRQASALELANLVLQAAGGLSGLMRATPAQLAEISGIGAVRASRILAALELGRRTLLRPPRSRVQLTTPREAARHLIPQFGARPVEEFGVVLLDTKHRVVRIVPVSVGTLDASLVHPREVFREAVTARAAAVLLFHNHPSGDPTPSLDDERLTRQLVDAGRLLGIEVLDHLILAETRYCSFRETGRLAPKSGVE